MKYPCLVPKRLCRTDIHVHLESEDTDNRGHPEKVVDLDLKCNFQDRAKTILTTEKKLVQITGHFLLKYSITQFVQEIGLDTHQLLLAEIALLV